MAPRIDGRKLKALREERMFKQKVLAERAGITQTTLSRLEHERTGAQIDTVLSIARALDVDPSEFVRTGSGGATPLGLARKRFPDEMKALLTG